MGAETLGLRSRRALSFAAHPGFTQPDLEIQTSKSLNPLARGRVSLFRPREGQFVSTGGNSWWHMQILAGHFDPRVPTCPACRRKLHRHGHYTRRRNGVTRPIPRWLCCGCYRTFSILPAELLPYRDVSCEDIQQGFDAWAFDHQSPESKSTASALKAFLEPTTQTQLRLACGQLLAAPLASGAALWRGMRRFCSTVEKLMRWLSANSGLSLLGRYDCQRLDRWSAPAARRASLTESRVEVPHTSRTPELPLRMLGSQEFA